MPDRRWLVLVAAACVCGALYLGIEIGGYAASDVGGRITLTAAIPAVLVIAFLAVVAIRLSTEIARPSGVASAPLTGTARSSGVGISIGIQVAFLLLVFPLLDVISKAVGLHGTTNVPLEHRSLGSGAAGQLVGHPDRALDGGDLDAGLPAGRSGDAAGVLAGSGPFVACMGGSARRRRCPDPVRGRGHRAVLDPPPHGLGTHRDRAARRPEHGRHAGHRRRGCWLRRR